jgi:ATPase subunit of ABC transporter with duplicated ATPase domains
VGKTTLLKLVAGTLAPQSGKVSVNGTLGVLRQVVQVKPDETVADLFGAHEGLALLRRAAGGKASVDELAVADWTLETRMASALGRLGLEARPETPLAALSGGQRTRAGLAALLFAEPDFILLDEPTNDLDRAGRAAVIDLLVDWRAGAIVVSHDRELLDTLDAIVELTSLGAMRYGGNFSHYRERKATELAAARHDLANAERRVAEVAQGAQAMAERKARKDRAGQRKRAKGDIPRIHLNTLKDRSENTSGENARLAERRRSQALADAAATRERIEILKPLSVALAPTGLPNNKTVLRIDRASGLRPGPAGHQRRVRYGHRAGADCRHRAKRLRQDDVAGPRQRTVATVVGERAGPGRFRHARPTGQPARSICIGPRQFPPPRSGGG